MLYLLTLIIMWWFPYGVKAATIFAPITIYVTVSISGKLWRLAIVKYNGIRVKTVISLVKNIADTIDKIVKIAVNLLVLLALAVSL